MFCNLWNYLLLLEIIYLIRLLNVEALNPEELTIKKFIAMKKSMLKLFA